MRPTILALDLEGTLISNAISQIPRPGLVAFMEFAHSTFSKIVLFTSVPQPIVADIAALLVQEGSAPAWFLNLPYIEWSGQTKDLRFVSTRLGETLLLDDHESYVHPGQLPFWVEAPLFAAPYPQDDIGLQIAAQRIKERIVLGTTPS
ncbi:NIF family HAD-type phosphatase [Stenotrophomonas pavanii]|uniref:NIF family HAD-type phosphatase n=1 Tax=Stenotrophomonas pavanii TaxID=487698 RepID=UPI003B5D581E